MTKNILIPTIALFLICLVATTLLAFANQVTAPIIEDLAVQTEIDARKTVLPDEAEKFEEKTSGGISYVVGLDKNGKEVGMVFTKTAKSYGGEIIVMTGIDSKGEISGVEILQINDTPGLGMNADKPEFKEKFVGMDDTITVLKNSAKAENNEIDAISGATISSKAVTDAVNAAMADYKTITEGKAGAN